MQVMQSKGEKLPQACKECLKKSLRTEHLNEEKKERIKTNLRKILRYILPGKQRVNLYVDHMA